MNANIKNVDNRCCISLLFLFWTMVSSAQFSQAERDSINRLNYKHFMHMKEQMGISQKNRPGPSGNPDDPNAANTNEAQVRDYELPDPLISKKGKRITTSEQWWQERRPEILKDFQDEVYGNLPEDIPGVDWQVRSVKDTMVGSYPVTEKMLIGKVDNSAYPDVDVQIELLVGVPRNTEKAVPLVMEFGFINPPFGKVEEPRSYFVSPYEPLWKQQLLSQGWGYAVIVPSSIQADNGAGLTSGIIGLVNKGQPREPSQWGALHAWAWGASKAVDYFETDPDVDQERIGIEGISRYGKAALVTMAFEPRISLGLSLIHI